MREFEDKTIATARTAPRNTLMYCTICFVILLGLMGHGPLLLVRLGISLDKIKSETDIWAVSAKRCDTHSAKIGNPALLARPVRRIATCRPRVTQPHAFGPFEAV